MIDSTKFATELPLFNHLSIGYKFPSGILSIQKVKFELTTGLNYRKMPHEVDFVNQSISSAWNLGWQAEISILPFYNRNFAIHMLMVNSLQSNHFSFGIGLSLGLHLWARE